ncbi:NAD(P)-binding domain-containing protein [Brachybacterium sp. JHP9]|uniref:NAD(P)-binding domain-containing protein n=1 Tax=Brachybacterium equifaecis TaxID=2910770 RepID=A0ABT0R293_9MICO|nr:NAD(P)-binding domain-containing protein [Brachybacterium equifaecis]
MAPTSEHPVIVIGAGPVGLAAAAHLYERNLPFLVLEAGASAGAAISEWGHTRLFSTWGYNIDTAARRLLDGHDWEAPSSKRLPSGHALREEYLEPLAQLPELAPCIRYRVRVMAVSRFGKDKTRTAGRNTTPFLVRIQHPDGTLEDLLASAVIDASGTWSHPNPLGQAGLPAPGEQEARATGRITPPLPDVLGRDRDRFAGRHVMVVGAGLSAANTLLDLAKLAQAEPTTTLTWAVRTTDLARVYGGGARDELAARGLLGSRLRNLVEAGKVEVLTSFTITGFTMGTSLTVRAVTPDGDREVDVDVVASATGFRPDHTMLSELRLHLDSAVEAPAQLGPLIDPEFHSCGSVEPHGERLLAHPDENFYIVGMKSYGRAPTFLMATGYEQVRSIVAALAGDRAAADAVELELPQTGVCSSDIGTSCG